MAVEYHPNQIITKHGVKVAYKVPWPLPYSDDVAWEIYKKVNRLWTKLDLISVMDWESKYGNE